jgi:hypothetical protein
MFVSTSKPPNHYTAVDETELMTLAASIERVHVKAGAEIERSFPSQHHDIIIKSFA